MTRNALRTFILPLLAVVFSLLLYYEFAYRLERTDFIKLITLYLGLFGMFYILYKHLRAFLPALIVCGLLFRLILLFATPSLSQDFYRFIWDGELIRMGMDPYLYSPQELYDSIRTEMPLAKDLYAGMGALSASHYSNYPPVNQFFFVLSAVLGGSTLMGKIVILKFIMILADVGILFFGFRILKLLKLPGELILLYFLNPFIILELHGNLHFEGVMAFFLLGGLWFLFKKNLIAAALFIAISISVKLIPLMFLPLMYMYLTGGKWLPEFRLFKEAAGFIVLTLVFVALSFTPFFSISNLDHFTESVGLWFSKFEFNASVYYLAREAGFWFKGYNIIGSIAPWIPVLTILTVVLLCFHRRNKDPKGLLTSMLWAVTVYLFLSTTVHPWYLTIPLLLSVLTDKRFVLAWTALVFLSYFTYSSEPYRESTLLLLIQYGIVFIFFFREMVWGKKIRAF